MPPSPAKSADVRFIGPVMGRYVLDDHVHLSAIRIFALRLQSISPTAIVASAPVTGNVGDTVQTHFAPFGNVRGRVARLIEGGFALDIEADEDGRRKLASRIAWFKKRTFAGLADKREHRRYMPREPRSAVVLHDGTVLPCLVIDLSASGVAISVDHDPVIGEPLAVGRIVGRVVRKLDVGFAVQFVTRQQDDAVESMLHAPLEWERAMRLREAAASAEIAAVVDALEARDEPEALSQ